MLSGIENVFADLKNLTQPDGQNPDPFARKVSAVLGELAKGMKTVRQYPPGHPSLLSTMDRVTVLLESLPLPPDGLELAVSRLTAPNRRIVSRGTPRSRSLTRSE